MYLHFCYEEFLYSIVTSHKVNSPNTREMNAFTLLILCMLLFPILSTRSSVLSTFHMSNFQIEIDKHTVGNVVKEVCHILRKYFLYRDRFSKSEWEFFEKEFCSRENKQMVISSFLFNVKSFLILLFSLRLRKS